MQKSHTFRSSLPCSDMICVSPSWIFTHHTMTSPEPLLVAFTLTNTNTTTMFIQYEQHLSSTTRCLRLIPRVYSTNTVILLLLALQQIKQNSSRTSSITQKKNNLRLNWLQILRKDQSHQFPRTNYKHNSIPHWGTSHPTSWTLYSEWKDPQVNPT